MSHIIESIILIQFTSAYIGISSGEAYPADAQWRDNRGSYLLGYTNWDDTSSRHGDCARTQADGTWYMQFCLDRYPYICEIGQYYTIQLQPYF